MEYQDTLVGAPFAAGTDVHVAPKSVIVMPNFEKIVNVFWSNDPVGP